MDDLSLEFALFATLFSSQKVLKSLPVIGLTEAGSARTSEA